MSDNLCRAMATGTALPEHEFQKTARRCVGYLRYGERKPCPRGSFFIPKQPVQTSCYGCTRRSPGTRAKLGEEITAADVAAGQWLKHPVTVSMLRDIGADIGPCGTCGQPRFLPDGDRCERCGGVRRKTVLGVLVVAK